MRILVIILLCWHGATLAATVTVGPGGADFPSVTEALQQGAAPTEILVAPGTYTAAGESFPIVLPPGVNVAAADPGQAPMFDAEGVAGPIFEIIGDRNLTVQPLARLSGLRFANGLAPVGGGLFVQDADVSLRNCEFIDCVAELDGGGMAILNGIADIQGCLFEGNTTLSRDEGSAGGGLFAADSNVTVTVTRFASNEAGQGGGIGAARCPLSVYRTTLIENVSASFGGGIEGLSDLNLTISESLLARNEAQWGGGGISFGPGCAMAMMSCTLVENTVANQRFPGEYNGAINATRSPGAVRVENSISWGNIPSRNSLLTVRYSCFDEGLQPGAGNLLENPRFVDPANGDWRLDAGSPLRNVGSPDAVGFDLDGNVRPNPGDLDGSGAPVADIGCYEYSEPLPSPSLLAGYAQTTIEVDRAGELEFLAFSVGLNGPLRFAESDLTRIPSGDAATWTFSFRFEEKWGGAPGEFLLPLERPGIAEPVWPYLVVTP